jgi:hypothetical protein
MRIHLPLDAGEESRLVARAKPHEFGTMKIAGENIVRLRQNAVLASRHHRLFRV